MRFHNNVKNYLQVISFGLTAGILARGMDFMPNTGLWNVSSIVTMYGLWIILAAVFIWRSTSHLAAGLNVLFLYLFTALAYFGSAFLLGIFLPRLGYGGFAARQFLYYAAVSVGCGILALILYSWCHGNWYGAIMLAVPIGLLAAETAIVLKLLHAQQTHLLQLLLNAGFCLYLGLQFRKLTKFKELYTVSVILFFGLSYQFLF